MAGGADTEHVLSRWARDELRPWRDSDFDAASATREFDRINAEIPSVFVMDIADGVVRLRDKRGFGDSHAAQMQNWIGRSDFYRRYFHDCVAAHRLDIATTIAVEMRDLSSAVTAVPLLSFQKPVSSTRVLIPDIDFMNHDWYRGTVDEPQHRDKIDKAVFVGSSTGGGWITASDVVAGRPERLRLARDLIGHPFIDFRIAAAVQCDTPATADLLRAQPYFSAPIAWSDQLRYRYLLSVDGNGATCSRVVNSLRSQSVLLKYRSPNLLYYFKGLVPGVHFLPIDAMDDVERIIGDAGRGNLDTLAIVANANAFAARYLTRDSVLHYGASLLGAYASVMRDGRGAALRA